MDKDINVQHECGYLIREATMEDVPTVAAYEREISIISFGDEAVTDMAFHEKKVDDAIKAKKKGMLVILHEGRVCGWLWMDLKTNFITKDAYVNFKSFYIDQEHRGKASELLLSRGMEFCEKMGAKHIVGKVHVDNVAMRTLYKSFGFAPTHLTMEKTLGY